MQQNSLGPAQKQLSEDAGTAAAEPRLDLGLNMGEEMASWASFSGQGSFL